MFDMGIWEVVLIFVILLIVVGPERLPKLARTAGFWVSKARSMVSAVRAEVEREIRVDELRRSINQQTHSEEFRELTDQVKSINSDMRSMERDMRNSIDRNTAQVGEAMQSRTGESSTGAKPGADNMVRTPPPTQETATAEADDGTDSNRADNERAHAGSRPPGTSADHRTE